MTFFARLVCWHWNLMCPRFHYCISVIFWFGNNTNFSFLVGPLIPWCPSSRDIMWLVFHRVGILNLHHRCIHFQKCCPDHPQSRSASASLTKTHHRSTIAMTFEKESLGMVSGWRSSYPLLSKINSFKFYEIFIPWSTMITRISWWTSEFNLERGYLGNSTV